MHQNIIDLLRINKEIITREIADIEKIKLSQEEITAHQIAKIENIKTNKENIDALSKQYKKSPEQLNAEFDNLINRLKQDLKEYKEKPETKLLNTKFDNIINKLKRELETIEEQQKAFNEKLNNIQDPELKEMAIAYFINKQSCEEIGKKYYLERTTVYKKLKRYFDN